jgi:hypothetical protein
MSATAQHTPQQFQNPVADAFPLSRIASAAPTSPREGFVLRFGFGPKSTYLRRYLETSGVEKTADLNLAQVFHNREMAARTAELLGARVVKIFTDADGGNPRLALLHNQNSKFSPLQACLRTCQLQEEKETTYEKDTRLKDNYSPEADHTPEYQPDRQDDRKRSEVVVVPGAGGAEIHVPNMYLGSSQSEGRRLLLDFLEQFLRVKITGFQSCWGFRPDLLLFEHPVTKTTLAVDTDTMLLPMAQARQRVQSKIVASSISFGIELPDPQSGYETALSTTGGGAVAGELA